MKIVLFLILEFLFLTMTAVYFDIGLAVPISVFGYLILGRPQNFFWLATSGVLADLAIGNTISKTLLVAVVGVIGLEQYRRAYQTRAVIVDRKSVV